MKTWSSNHNAYILWPTFSPSDCQSYFINDTKIVVQHFSQIRPFNRWHTNIGKAYTYKAVLKSFIYSTFIVLISGARRILFHSREVLLHVIIHIMRNSCSTGRVSWETGRSIISVFFWWLCLVVHESSFKLFRTAIRGSVSSSSLCCSQICIIFVQLLYDHDGEVL